MGDGAEEEGRTSRGEEAKENGGGRLSFFIDGAHTPESMETCAHWFADQCEAMSRCRWYQVILLPFTPLHTPSHPCVSHPPHTHVITLPITPV